jgi:hypothetical protein
MCPILSLPSRNRLIEYAGSEMRGKTGSKQMAQAIGKGSPVFVTTECRISKEKGDESMAQDHMLRKPGPIEVAECSALIAKVVIESKHNYSAHEIALA